MSTDQVNFEATKKLLELARNFEKNGNIQSALETYIHALQQLPDESPLRKEIEIIIKQLEDRVTFSKPVSKHFQINIFFMIVAISGMILALVIFWRPDASRKQVDSNATDKAKSLSTATILIASKSLAFTNSPESSKVASLDTVINTKQASIFVRIVISHVALRYGPSVSYPEHYKLYYDGDSMKVLGRYYDWLYVESSTGEKGWLLSKRVDIEPSTVEELPAITEIPTLRPTKRPAYP